MTQLEAIRFVRECYPEYNGQLFMNLTDISKLFGLSHDKMKQHIIMHGVPHYRPVREKLYCVLEVLESIQKTRNSA